MLYLSILCGCSEFLKIKVTKIADVKCFHGSLHPSDIIKWRYKFKKGNMTLAKCKAMKMRNWILSHTVHQWKHNILLYIIQSYVNIFRNSDLLNFFNSYFIFTNISKNVIFLKVLYSKLPHLCCVNVIE